MPRYIVKFNDGTQTEIGAPGPDSEKIRNTITAKAEKDNNKKVASLQQVKTETKTKKVTSKQKSAGKSPKATTAKLQSAAKGKGKTTAKLATKKAGPKIKAVQKSIKKANNYAGKDQASLKGQLTSLENTLRIVVKDLSSQINTLRNAILVSRKRELLSELDEIESQI